MGPIPLVGIQGAAVGEDEEGQEEVKHLPRTQRPAEVIIPTPNVVITNCLFNIYIYKYNIAQQRGGTPASTEPCRDFLNGNCSRGANCRWSHATNQGNRNAGPSSQTQPPRDLQSHFQAAGLNFPGLANDQFSAGGTNATPGQTHHFLKQYVADSFRFNIPEQVYRFVDLLCNASSQNPAWVRITHCDTADLELLTSPTLCQTPEDGQVVTQSMDTCDCLC